MLEALQTAIVTRFGQNATLAATSGLFYSEAPKGTTYPYVTFELDVSNEHNAGAELRNTGLDFIVFSDSAATLEVNSILDALRTAFVGTEGSPADPLTVTGRVNCIRPQEQGRTLVKNEAGKFRGVMNFNLILE